MTQTQEQSASTGDTPFVPIEKIVSLCKRRGFIYPNSEIYGGVSGIYDFGPLGVELRNNIRRYWCWSMVQTNDNVVGIEGAIITLCWLHSTSVLKRDRFHLQMSPVQSVLSLLLTRVSQPAGRLWLSR